jgi:hypothetical protein
MNVFLLQSNIDESSKEFAAIDPLRARKQLLECCQILSCADYHQFATTWMARKDKVLYKFPKAHRNHPVVLASAFSYDQFELTRLVAEGLAKQFPNHASSESLSIWNSQRLHFNKWSKRGLTSCRTGYPITLVETLSEYAGLMRQYLMNKLIKKDAYAVVD